VRVGSPGPSVSLCVFALPPLAQSRQPPGDSPLELIVLASGGPRASARGSTSYIVLLDGTPRILIDAGANAFVEVGKLNLSLDQMDIVLLTHLHIDHTSDLPAIFNERALGARNAIKWRIFGPDGAGQFPSTSKFIHTLFDAGGIYECQRTFGQNETVNVTDLAITLASPQKEIVRDGTGERSLTIEEIATHHDDCPSIAYRIHYKSLSITFAGDMDASALPNLEHLAKETDLLVVHAAVLDPPGSPAILYTLHTAPAKLGEVARAAGVKRLLLSHIPGLVEARRSEVTAAFAGPTKGPSNSPLPDSASHFPANCSPSRKHRTPESVAIPPRIRLFAAQLKRRRHDRIAAKFNDLLGIHRFTPRPLEPPTL
jgi:ribonuclease BN (tRNA processing enzyme)